MTSPATHASSAAHPGATAPLLAVRGLHAYYGKSHILHGLDLSIGPGEVVTLLGRNGSGRSTALKAIMGLVPAAHGRVELLGEDLRGAAPFRISRAGIAYVPEKREVFSNLTVDENLAMGVQPPRAGAPAWTVEEMFGYFPVLRKRRNTRGGYLSGGEQQMLTICRSLLGNPHVILVDEPTEGLAPLLVAAVAEVIREIHARGVAVLLVEQKLTIALKVASRLCVMGHGRIVFQGTPASLAPGSPVVKEWLAV